MWTIELIVIAAMIAFNSVFAGYEIALASIRQGRLHALVRDRRRGAAAALRMKQNMEASLAAIQLGITVVAAVAAATGGAGAEESIEPVLKDWGLSDAVARFLAIALVVAPLTVITIIFGELVPKVFALGNKQWVCLTLSPPMEWFAYSVWPAVKVLEFTVTWIVKLGERSANLRNDASEGESPIKELQGAAAMARVLRLIGHREEGIIVNASRLSATPLQTIMLPAEHMSMLVVDQTLAEALVTAHQDMHTRFPVTEEALNPQRIIGYANFKDIVAALRLSPGEPTLRSLVRQLSSFDANSSISDCLEQLMRQRTHIGLVREGADEVVGMVTLEDIVEELVGEIYDEFDRMPHHLTQAGAGWIAGGFVALSRLRDVAGIQLPVGATPALTLNEWIGQRLGRPPRGGDELKTDNWRVLVRKTRRTLVHEAYLSPINDQPATPNTDT
jgi:putative hemolysin